MNAENKFDGRAESYATELIDCLYDSYGVSKASVIADIGSGTGKLSKQLLDRGGSEVFCVEPNADMRQAADSRFCRYKYFHSVDGSAEFTSLNDASVDCITVAQAFHWFDVQGFKRECIRIIKRRGKVFLIWNVRTCDDIINREWADVFSRCCPEFKGFSNGIKRDDDKIKAFFDGGYDYVAFDNPLLFDKESFIKRSLSSSYSLKENDIGYSSYISALSDLFDKYESDGLISVSNRSVAYIGEVK